VVRHRCSLAREASLVSVKGSMWLRCWWALWR